MKRTGTTTTSRSFRPVEGNDDEGLLPLTDISSSSSSRNNHPVLLHRNTKRRSVSKKLMIIRMIGMILISCLVFIYILATRHVILQYNNNDVGGSVGFGVDSNNVNVNSLNQQQRVLYQPIIIVDKKDRKSIISPSSSYTANNNNNNNSDNFKNSNKPRTVGYYFAVTDSDSYIGTEHLDPNRIFLYNDNTRIRIVRDEFMTKSEVRAQEALLDSRDYRHGEADTLQDMGEDCIAQYDWQEKSFPTCNHLMEIDMTNLIPFPVVSDNNNNNNNNNNNKNEFFSAHSFSKYLAAGYWRDVWSVKNSLRSEHNDNDNGNDDKKSNNNNNVETFVLKSMRYTHDYVPRNYDRHRRDAVAMERLTSSAFVMEIYAACGNSGLFEYADGGSLEDSIYYNKHHRKKDNFKPWSSKERLVVAYQAISGIADLHNFAKEGVPSIAHTDIHSGQFVYVEETGLYKLNDFNRARFLPINKKTNEICKYEVGNNPGTVCVACVHTLYYIVLYCIVLYCEYRYTLIGFCLNLEKSCLCYFYGNCLNFFLFLSFRRMYCIQFRSPEEYQYVPQTEKIGEFFRAIITTVVVKFQLKFLTHFLFFLVCRYLFIRKYPLFRIDWWVSICT